jgi:hypothetical protein
MITWLELGITDGVSVSLVSPWPWRSAAKQSDWSKYWGKKGVCCDNGVIIRCTETLWSPCIMYVASKMKYVDRRTTGIQLFPILGTLRFEYKEFNVHDLQFQSPLKHLLKSVHTYWSTLLNIIRQHSQCCNKSQIYTFTTKYTWVYKLSLSSGLERFFYKNTTSLSEISYTWIL